MASIRTRGILERLVGVALVVGAVMASGLVWSSATHAAGPVGCASSADPHCVVSVADPGNPGRATTSNFPTGGTCVPPSGPGIPAGVDCSGCIWGPYLGVAADAGAQAELVGAGGKGQLEQQDCYPGPTTDVEFFPPGTAAPPPGVSAAQLGGKAVSLLPRPTIVTSSAPGAQGRAFAMTFVNLATFFWVGGAAWQGFTATANDGFKAVTATAAPFSSPGRWVTAMRCPAPGRACHGRRRFSSPTAPTSM
jgi:hypothetical protein